MAYGFYISSDGACAQDRRVEIIANNLANVDTVGFKKEMAVFRARPSEAIEEGMAMPNSGSLNDLGGGTLLYETKTDFSTGPIKVTGRQSDMAIKGDGFFMVQKDDEQLLTKAGNFTVTGAGQLVTQQGYPVLSESGEPIVIEDPKSNWAVTPNGCIESGGTVYKLGLVKPESPGDLVKVGENLFRSLSEPKQIQAKQRSVLGGSLEYSSVNPTSEMVNMITASRAMEANIKMMQTQDQMIGGLLSRVLKS